MASRQMGQGKLSPALPSAKARATYRMGLTTALPLWRIMPRRAATSA